jgi:hypothetical protein
MIEITGIAGTLLILDGRETAAASPLKSP